MLLLQLNDTHPTIAVPELMRILMDENKLGWTRSWAICCKVSQGHVGLTSDGAGSYGAGGTAPVYKPSNADHTRNVAWSVLEATQACVLLKHGKNPRQATAGIPGLHAWHTPASCTCPFLLHFFTVVMADVGC